MPLNIIVDIKNRKKDFDPNRDNAPFNICSIKNVIIKLVIMNLNNIRYYLNYIDYYKYIRLQLELKFVKLKMKQGSKNR